ncbi:MAG TPA: GIY-YIG nuclease family protein [Longimicrobium sp.]|nr:GIY-YIG nuclease family protein [Longimicrobium sp.]
MPAHCFYVYILSNASRTLYTGVTNDLVRRMWEHQNKIDPRAFTSRYHVTQLVWFEETGSIVAAIEREKQIKGWTRAKKIALVNSMNPTWRDLSADEGFFRSIR